MQKSEIDYQYSLSLLKKMNVLSHKNTLLPNMFFYEGYNLWHFYQQRIFEDIKVFSVTKEFKDQGRVSFPIAIKDAFGKSFIVAMSLLAAVVLIVSRRKVIVYSIDRTNSIFGNDFRLKTLYQYLTDERISYTEIFHTRLNRSTIMNSLKRKRSAFYLEALDAVFSVLSSVGLAKKADVGFVDNIELLNLTPEETKFVKEIIKRYAYQRNVSIFKIKVLKYIFSLTNLKTLFAIDDARYYNEIILACKLSGIKTYALQHGHFTKYHVGWLRSDLFKGKVAVPDFLLVWSSYWKDELLQLNCAFPSQNIIIGGVAENVSKKWKKKKSLANQNQGEITVLIPYETSCPKSEVTAYIEKMLKCSRVRVIFKLRPDIPKEQQLTEYGLKEKFHEHFSIVTDAGGVMPQIDIVAGVYSTFLYDVLAFAKRVLILKTMSDYGEGMVMNGLADRLDIKENICFKLDETKNIPEDIIVERRKKLYGEKNILLLDTLSEIGIKNKLV